MRNQKTSTEQKQTSQQLSDKELEVVAGGLNPQPLPPSPPPTEFLRFFR
jgi:hypothetical protein